MLSQFLGSMYRKFVAGFRNNKSNNISIRGKKVLIPPPDKLNSICKGDHVGHEKEMRDITAAWMAGPDTLPMAPLLLGEPGVGKNKLVYEMAKRTGQDLYTIQGHEDITAEDLACAARFSDDAKKKMDYVLSPLLTAMALGGICFIDEIAKFRLRALALLVSVLDERRYMYSTLLGERIYAHEGFRFIAATNTSDLTGNTLPDFVRQRLDPVINVDYPTPDIIDLIILKRFPSLQNTAEATKNFWQLWYQQRPNRPPSPREAIHIYSYTIGISRLEASGSAGGGPLSLRTDSTETAVSKNQLTYAFNLFFNGSRGGNRG